MYTEFDVAVTATLSFLHNRRIPSGLRRLCFVGVYAVEVFVFNVHESQRFLPVLCILCV